MNMKRKPLIPAKVLLLVLLIVGIQLAIALLPHFLKSSKQSALSVAHAGTGSEASALHISRAWSPEAPPVVKVLAAYMVLENRSDKDIHITGLQGADFDKVEIHNMESKDGMMRMVEQKRLRIPAGKTVSLQPGELHMMLIGPRRVFRDGDRFTLTLTLDNGRQQDVQVLVSKRNDF